MSDELEAIRSWVLYHVYSDGSGGCTIARVYLDEARAKEDRELMQHDKNISASEWHLVEVPLYGDSPI